MKKIIAVTIIYLNQFSIFSSQGMDDIFDRVDYDIFNTPYIATEEEKKLEQSYSWFGDLTFDPEEEDMEHEINVDPRFRQNNSKNTIVPDFLEWEPNPTKRNIFHCETKEKTTFSELNSNAQYYLTKRGRPLEFDQERPNKKRKIKDKCPKGDLNMWRDDIFSTDLGTFTLEETFGCDYNWNLLSLKTWDEDLIKHYLQEAKNGSPSAQYGLAFRYYLFSELSNNRDEIRMLKEEAFNWCQKAALQNFPSAQLLLAKVYLTFFEDKENCLVYLTKAAQNNDPRALYILGDFYENGSDKYEIKKDIEYAMELYLKSSNLGYAPSQMRLAIFYFKGIGIQKNINLFSYWLKASARQGYIQAVATLGAYYYNGMVCDNKTIFMVDKLKGIELLKSTANQGQCNSMVKLGLIHRNNYEFYLNTKLIEEAVSAIKKSYKWYERAAKSGSALAQYEVGALLMRSDLIGINQNLIEARKLLEQSAQQGYAPAAETLKSSLFLNDPNANL